MATTKKKVRHFYDAAKLEDAPEFHEFSAAVGPLTWGTWDRGVRPVEQRAKDFVAAFPPQDPTRYCRGSMCRREDGTLEPGSPASRIERFCARDWRAGSLYEVLSRYGLRLPDAPPVSDRSFNPDPFRETAKRRNVSLRVLHGGVDIEPANMDAAKAAYLDRQEKERAAQDVREARRRMRDELEAEE